MLTLFFEGRAFTGTTDKPLGQEAVGNPALICFTEDFLPQKTMQSIARLAASPMTTFIAPTEIRDTFSLRYFSPNGSEVDLCGHATFASTYFIRNFVADIGKVTFALNPAFHSAGFALSCNASPDGIGLSTRSYASKPCKPSMATDSIIEALDIDKNEVQQIYETELKDYVFILRSNKDLRKAHPDFDALIRLGQSLLPHRTLVISAQSNEAGFDYEARVFVPLLGINEDIACGSVNCSLAPLWAGLTGNARLKMFYCTPDEAGDVIVGGVQDILIESEQLTINSNVLPVWSHVFQSQGPEKLLRDDAFISLMEKVGKAPNVRSQAETSYVTKNVLVAC